MYLGGARDVSGRRQAKAAIGWSQVVGVYTPATAPFAKQGSRNTASSHTRRPRDMPYISA